MDKKCNRPRMHDQWVWESFDSVFNEIGDPICILDNQFRILKSNKAMAARLGLSPEECEGQTCYRVVHNSDHHLDHCPHAQTLMDGRSHTVELY